MQNHAKKICPITDERLNFRDPWVTIATAVSTKNTLNVSFNR